MLLEVDLHLVKGIQLEEEDLNQETSVANEVDRLDLQFQLLGPMINTIGRKSRAKMMAITRNKRR